VYVILRVVDNLKTILALTYDHSGAVGTWTPSALPAGHPPGMRS
jgi:hypothetical protein